jgi:hypothetical protein
MAKHGTKQQLSSSENLAWMRERMEADPNLTRYGLARQACARLNWTDPRGRLKQMACRKELVRLERRGEIVLPRVCWRRPLARADAAFTAPEVRCALADLGAVTLKAVRGGTSGSRTWNAMMKAHHPLGDRPLCGAQIRYLIMSERHGVLGGLAVSASAWRLSARDEWIGWSDAGRGENLNGIVCNSRFLILPTVEVKNLASHVLAQLTRRVSNDWRGRYGLSPWLMETFVNAARPGTCYRAANWIEVGVTTGRGRQDGAHEAKLTRKRVFLYPLCLETLGRLRPTKATPDAGARPGPRSGDDDKDWLQREFGGARLGDSRLTRRLPELARDFFARPMASIPQACNGSMARTAAAYRFFDNPKVDMDALLEPHRQATIERMSREPLALIAQDTSSLNYTTHREMEGVGPIGTKVNGPQGLILHSAMVFLPDGLPLGIMHADCKARDPAAFGKKHERAQKPIEEKESYKWIKALRPIREAAKQCPNTKIVVVADREADIYEYFLAAQEKKLDLLVRARLNRSLATEDKAAGAEDTGSVKPEAAGKCGKKRAVVEEACELGEIIGEPDPEPQRLQAHLESLPEAGRIELSVPRHGKQKARTALMSVRYAQVLFAPPKAKAKLPPLPMWVVWTAEISPPKDAEPLEWFLLTTVPISSLENAAERIVWYGRRWGIEVFHRILKSGCNIEDRQLGTANRLINCLAIDMVVAWRIHHLTWLGRETPELPCTVAFDDDQWKAVVLFTTRKPAPPTPPSLNEMIRMIARLGGHLGRKSDGDPGTETLWKGLQRMDDIAWTAKICMEAYDLRHPE